MKNIKKIIAIGLSCIFVLACITAYALGQEPAWEESKKQAEQENEEMNNDITFLEETDSLPADASTSTAGANDTSVRGKNKSNSKAGFTAADSDGSNALVFRMGLAQLTNEDVVYANDIDSKALAVQQYGAKYYVATQGASFVYGHGTSLATEDYRGHACVTAPAGSTAEKVLQCIYTNTPDGVNVAARDDGSLYIVPEAGVIDALMSELASLDGINQGLYQLWQSELTSGSASTHPVVIVIEVCGVVVGDGANYFAAPSDMCLRIGGQTAYEALLTTDLNAYGGTVTSLTDKAIASLCGYDSGTNDYDTWPYRWVKRFFATTWKPGTIKFLPSSGTRSLWAQTAWQTLSAGGSEKGINGCTIVTIGGAGVAGIPTGYFDWHINAQYAIPNSAGYCEDQIVYTSEKPDYSNDVGELCIAQENYALWESWFNSLGADTATLEIKTYHLGQNSFTTNVDKIKSSGKTRTGNGIHNSTGSFTQEITLSKAEFFEALENETKTFDLATDMLGPSLNDNGMLSVAYAMDVNVRAGGQSVPLTNESCHWIVYSTGDKKTYTFQQVIEGPFAQIKQGGLDAEKYEAMAGTPTTEDLFVSMGGNQYIVNMQFRYCEDDYKRTYHCYTKEVPNYTFYQMSTTTVEAAASAGETASGSTVPEMNASNALIASNYNEAKGTKLAEARTAIKDALSDTMSGHHEDSYRSISG